MCFFWLGVIFRKSASCRHSDMVLDDVLLYHVHQTVQQDCQISALQNGQTKKNKGPKKGCSILSRFSWIHHQQLVVQNGIRFEGEKPGQVFSGSPKSFFLMCFFPERLLF